MKYYNVSPKALDALVEVAGLTAPETKELAEFVSANLERLETAQGAYEQTAQATFKKLDRENALSLLETLVPFIFGVISSEKDPKEVIEGLVDAVVRALKRSGKEPPPQTAKRMRANLSTIFDDPQTRLKAKSLRLLSSQQRKFTDCEILSDIRPVFSSGGELTIVAAVTYHTLRLGHTATGDDIFISMDSQDLKVLKDAIDRALKKEVEISRVVERAQIEQVKVS